ncbi:hypothetical protein A3C37_04900 [Candidatus Peribacteria bacterium RIFCSPHIGHO2_02_FULL_53_20]|nr:MAG: hypothetical protein A3C37_04900 [Candidatus Peribacteria bacterium RIFCSPHIGHO2_02_FULL_53_20]
MVCPFFGAKKGQKETWSLTRKCLCITARSAEKRKLLAHYGSLVKHALLYALFTGCMTALPRTRPTTAYSTDIA